MAYRAEIEIGVKGANKLEQLQTRIDNLARKITDINDASIFDPVEPKLIQSIQNYSNALEVAARNLKDVELGQDEERKAVQQYVQALGEANQARELQNRLITQQIAKQTAANRVVREAATGFSAEVYGPQIARGTGRQGDPAFPSSPVGGRVERLIAIKKGELELEKALLDLEKKSAAELSKKVQLQENLVEGTREVLELAARARQQQEFRAGASGSAIAGPLAGPGSLGFPVALPGLSEAESKGLQIAKEKLQIINRTVQRRKELGGLAANLQRLDGKAKVAIADANRDQAKLNDLKQEQLATEELIRKEQVKQSIIRRRRIVDNAKEARRRTGEAVSSGIIGGAFPLLFGQGPGAALGGGIGGAAGGAFGGQFGFGLSLVGTQLGTIFDGLVGKATNLADSLKTTGDILSGLENAGFKVSDATKSVIASYEEAGLLADAYSLALAEVNRVLGPDGTAKLDAYRTETEKLSDEFEKVSGALQSELIPALTGLLRIILGAKAAFDGFANSPIGQVFLKKATEFAGNLPGGGGLKGAAFTVGVLQQIGAPTGPAKKPDAQRLAEENASMGKLITQQAINKAAQEERYLVAAKIDLAKIGNDLTNKEVVAAKQKVIQETFLAEVRKKGITPQEILLAGDKKRLALAQLNRSVNDAANRASEKQARTSQQALQEQQKALSLVQRLQAQEQLTEVGSGPEAQRLQIQNQYLRTLETISRLKNQDYTAELQNLALAIRTNQEANLQAKLERDRAAALQQAVAPLVSIREQQIQSIEKTKEYNRLIAEGVLPSEAKRIAAFNTQATLLVKQVEEKIKLVEVELLSLDANDAKTKELKRQLQLFKDQKKAIEGEASKGPGKGAPEASPADIIREQIGTLQEELDAMTNLGNIAVNVANSIGGAFSTAFQEVVSGSKSVQEGLADMFKTVAADFLKMAADIIAKQLMMIALQALLKALGAPVGGGGGGASSVPSSAYGDMSVAGPSFFTPKAKGGFVTGPTPALVGEGGEAEYIIPESKMRESMSRYSRGARGGSVIPESGGSGTSGEGGGTAVAAPIDVRYTVERINSVDYVTADQFQAGLRQAADQGAKQGEQKTLKRLQMSSGTRKRLGM